MGPRVSSDETIISPSATPTAALAADQPTSFSPTQTRCFALASLKTSMTSSVLNPTAYVEGFLL